MAYQFTETTENLLSQINKTPLIILEIEGSQYLYGTGKILETAKWDDPRINWDNTEGITWDGFIEIENSRPYISTKDGLTKDISQQLIVEKGGAGSVSTMTIPLVDKDGEVAEDLSFDQIGDPLGKRANVYLMLEGGIFPQDSVDLFRGYVNEIYYEAGLIKVSITSPANETRQPVLEQYTSITTADTNYKSLNVLDFKFVQTANLTIETATVEIRANGGPINENKVEASLSGSDVLVLYDNTIPAPVLTSDPEQVKAKDIADAINNSSAIKGFLEAEITGNAETIQVPLAATAMQTDTVINVESTESFIESQDVLTSYIRIEDEIMQVTSTTSTSFTVIRGVLGTTPVSHEAESEAISAYRLIGFPIPLALKLLLSKEGNAYAETPYIINSLSFIDGSTTIDGAIVVNNYNIQRTLGLEVGDLIDLVGTTSNDGEKVITGFGTLITGKSFIIVEGGLSVETGLTLNLRVKSQHNLLPFGIGLDMDQVDVAQFTRVAETFSASFIEYDFLFQDTVENVKEFIESELFNPQALYYLPKGAKISCKFTSPPFTVDDLPTLNTRNIVKLSSVQSKRSTHKYLTNVVIHRYNPDVIEEKFRDKVITLSSDSFERIQRGTKRQIIESSGLRRSSATKQVLENLGSKYLNRYRFAARSIKNVEVLYELGMRLQVGDIVFFGGEDTQLVNIQTGERDFPVAQYEIINTKMDIIQGKVMLSLLETGFGIDGIAGVFSPSSLVGTGSTSSKLRLLDRILDTSQTSRETEKWENKVGLKVRVFSDDYTRDETTILKSLDPTDLDGVILDPPLSFTPQVNDLIELATYPEYGDSQSEEKMKLTYVFSMPSMEITNVVSPTVLDMENVDGLEIGMEINIHSDDYVRDSETVLIDNIVGLQITLNQALNITPQVGDRLEVYAHTDAKGYRYL